MSTPPVGYVLTDGSTDHWVGPEVMNRGWIITPAWNAVTNTHSVELWAANHEPPNYANLSPADALQLAADLTTTAAAVLAAGSTETNSKGSN